MQVTRIDRTKATRGNPYYFDGEVNVQTLVSSTGEEPYLYQTTGERQLER